MVNTIFQDINNHTGLQRLFDSCPYNILAHGKVVQFDTEKFELFQDCSYERMYILVEGEVEVYLSSYSGRKIILDTYTTPGMLIGEQEAIMNQPYSASIVNITPVKLIEMSNKKFLEWLKKDSQLNHLFVRDLCNQIYHLTKTVGRYSLINGKDQVIQIMYELYIKNKIITRQKIIKSVSTSPRHVNRILQSLVISNQIVCDNTVITVVNPKQLFEF